MRYNVLMIYYDNGFVLGLTFCCLRVIVIVIGWFFLYICVYVMVLFFVGKKGLATRKKSILNQAPIRENMPIKMINPNVV